ncbi:MAG: asparagine synthase (glutamine-hydrolyzing) [Planctomycetaceae bacterium]|nr:asparagine synthase (glutamine-hydrolyzing) [Planctomycetaceae bacterium]
MCGLTGAVWTRDGTPISLREVHRMTQTLRHRGPDAGGLLFASYDTNSSRWTHRSFDAESDSVPDLPPTHPGCALGHRRLSIIDLSETGTQPLSNEDGTIWTVFNGEIYNYRELTSDLKGRGHRFRTETDTEVIVHLYEEYGEQFVDHLRGMFAIAVWDSRREQLLLVRDRMGQKPLYYRQETGRLAFASELKALLQIDHAPRTLNRSAVDDYLLYQYVPHPNCILEGYHKLPPGHLALYRNGDLTVRTYWTAPYEPDPSSCSPNRTPEEWGAELKHRLSDAVKMRLRSDVPLGAFLSGGIDSTIIVGLMQELSENQTQTFSIGFPVKEFDESSFAREAADHLGTRHHEQIVHPDAVEILPKLIWHYDEPFSDSSAIPTMHLSEMTRQHVTVSLSGDGGDELFCGYPRYRAVELAEKTDRLPPFIKRLLGLHLWQMIPGPSNQRSIIRRGKRFLSALSKSREERYLNWISIFNDDFRAGIWTDEFRESLSGHQAKQLILDAYRSCPSRDFITQTTCVDVQTYLPCDILKKVDIASMAFSLECRSPFLDHGVAELAAQMPIELKMDARQQKKILLEQFGDFFPPRLKSRSKMGFGVPLNVWFRKELKPLLHDILLSERSLNRGIFRQDYLEILIREHLDGRWDHAYRLWNLLCLELWQRTYLDAEKPPTSAPTVI